MTFDYGVSSLVNLNSHLRFGQRIKQPKSNHAVTTINYSDEVAPDTVNLSPQHIENIWLAVLAIYNTGTHPAISVCIRKQGEIILNRSIGHAQGNGPQEKYNRRKILMTPNTPACYFSGSKPITAFLIHLLAEDRRLELQHTVAHYLPEFGINGKQNITINQILTHHCGLSMPKDIDIRSLSDSHQVWQHICELTTSEKFVGTQAYQAITGGFILEKIIQKVTGNGIQHLLDMRIRQPMEMDCFQYGMPQDEQTKLATNYATGMDPIFPISNAIKNILGSSLKHTIQLSNKQLFNNAIIPSANLTGTAEEMNRFYQMLLNNGRWNDHEICHPETINSFIQPHHRMQFDRHLLTPMRYSAGLMLGDNPIGMWGINSKHSFGHVGLINKLYWADPKRGLSVSLHTTGMPVIANHMPAIVNFIRSINLNIPSS